MASIIVDSNSSVYLFNNALFVLTLISLSFFPLLKFGAWPPYLPLQGKNI